VLNALSIDPGRQWKGVWRWFSESQLQVRAPPPRHVLSRDVWQCCVDNDTVRRLGVTFDQFVCLGRCAVCRFAPPPFPVSLFPFRV
jgi:glutathione gamma-glutamylcysteinyltransferase